MWSAGCIFAELLLRKPILPGKNEFEQIDLIFKLLGTPDTDTWPSCKQLQYYDMIISQTPRKYQSRFEDKFGALDPLAKDLLRKLLSMDPETRMTADDALDHEYFWSDPVPATPDQLPKYPPSHEFTARKRRQQGQQPQQQQQQQQQNHSQQQQQSGGTAAHPHQQAQYAPNYQQQQHPSHAAGHHPPGGGGGHYPPQYPPQHAYGRSGGYPPPGGYPPTKRFRDGGPQGGGGGGGGFFADAAAAAGNGGPARGPPANGHGYSNGHPYPSGAYGSANKAPVGRPSGGYPGGGWPQQPR